MGSSPTLWGRKGEKINTNCDIAAGPPPPPRPSKKKQNAGAWKAAREEKWNTAVSETCVQSVGLYPPLGLKALTSLVQHVWVPVLRQDFLSRWPFWMQRKALCKPVWRLGALSPWTWTFVSSLFAPSTCETNKACCARVPGSGCLWWVSPSPELSWPYPGWIFFSRFYFM